MIHDVDYCVKDSPNIEALNRELDSLRLGGLAHLEELHQLLTKNKALAESKGWNIEVMLSHLEPVIETLRTKI